MASANLYPRLVDRERGIHDLSFEGSPITLGLVAPDGTIGFDRTKGSGSAWQMVNGTWVQFGASGVAAWSTVTGIPVPLSAVALPAGNRTVTTLQDHLANMQVFNVRDYGAVGNGSTDDTTAFTKAHTDLVAAGGGKILMPGRGYNYILASGLVMPAYSGIEGEGRGTLLTFTGASGAALTLGDNTTALNYKNWAKNFALYLSNIATTAFRLQNTCGAALRDLYIEGPYNNFATRTNIGVDIDAGNVSTFFNSLANVLCNHMHIGFKVESTGTSYATTQYFSNCSSGGDKAAGDTTSVGFWFTRSPVTTPLVGNGEGSVVSGGNVEDCGTGVYIEGGGILVDGLRYEANTTDVHLGVNSGNNTIGGSSTLVTVQDDAGAGSCNSVSKTSDREGSYTATMVPVAGSITLTAGAGGNLCSYHKEGKKVTVWGEIVVSSVSTPSGSVQILLPFTAKGGSNNYAAASIRASGLKATATTAVQGYVDAGYNHIIIEKFAAGATSDMGGDIQAGSAIIFSCTYLAA